MNLFRILRKEFTQMARDWRVNAMMILLPLLLMAVLGTALGGVFGGRLTVDASVLYSVQGDGPLVRSFAAFIERARAMGVRFTVAETGKAAGAGGQAGIAAVKDVSYACYIVVVDTGITLYKNDRYGVEAGIVQSLLAVFLQRANAVRAVALVAPAALPGALAGADGPRVAVEALDGRRQPRALDYYAVTMLTFIILMASVFGMGAMRKERKLRTARRILSAPVRRGELLAGKVGGGLVVTFLQILLVLVFSATAMGAYWGSDIPTVLLILFSEAVMAVSIGAGVAFLIPSEGAGVGILNSIIPLLVLFAGGYGPLNPGPVFAKIASADPLTWVNRALFAVIYDRDFSSVTTAVVVCVGVAAGFCAIAALLSRKEAD